MTFSEYIPALVKIYAVPEYKKTVFSILILDKIKYSKAREYQQISLNIE